MLEVKVIEVSRKGSGWGELNGGMDGCRVDNDGDPVALWAIFWGEAGGDLEQCDWLSERVL